MRDFNLFPPASVSIETFDFGRDSNGNPTAKHLVLWNNGKTGVDYEGGSYASKRREDYGYSNTGTSESALHFLTTYFPRTVWAETPGTRTGSRAETGSTATYARVYDKEATPVIFRTVTKGMYKGVRCAFFPTIPGGGGVDSCKVYSEGELVLLTASKPYFLKATRPSLNCEIEPIAARLEAFKPKPYILEIGTRWTRTFDAIRWEHEKATP
jgi:hypothetical protein